MKSRVSDYQIIPFCPVLYPSITDFSEFQSYIEKIEKEYSKEYGMVKIIPPQGWKARSTDCQEALGNKIIIDPIEQNPQGKEGVYECVHIIRKSMSFREYKKKAIAFDKVTDGKSIVEVEDLFWKSISFSPPLYGSDIQMSIFDENVKWNLKNLDSILNQGLDSKISGVNTPYLYIGSWKTLFSWHKEDLDLSGINFLHYGKPKFWYCIPKSEDYKLENIAKNNFPDAFAKCNQFLRHKTSIINPYQILRKCKGNIKMCKIAQNEGEFIIVFSGAYHTGFNWGFNIAEAVNFASLNWLTVFQESKPCKCHLDNVSINPQNFINNLLKKRPDLIGIEKVKQFKQWIKQQQIYEEQNFQSSDKQYSSFEQKNRQIKNNVRKVKIKKSIRKKNKKN